MSKTVYDIIKKQNGEAFAQGIRRFDSGIFDIPNLPEIVFYAGRNSLPLLEYLESLKEIEVEITGEVKDPFELLEQAGYHAFYADTLEKQNSITNYYQKEELLCTFKDADRYKNYHIIHAIKKNVHEIKREYFKGVEKREDDYGTSVISIQILKTGGFISIKNRYNHTVDACDNTFYSNPDRIIEGLSLALKKYFKVDFAVKKQVFLPDGYVLVNNKILKYDIELNNVYVGNGFYCKDGNIHLIDKNSQLQIDGFVLDLKEKKILNPANADTAYQKMLEKEIKGETLQVKNQGGIVHLMSKQGEILTVKDRALKSITLRKVEVLPEKAFYAHLTLEEVNALSVISSLHDVLAYCPNLKKVNLPNLSGNFYSSLFKGSSCEVEAPLLEEKGIHFFGSVAFDIKKKRFLTKGLFLSGFLSLLEQEIAFGDITYQQNGDEFEALNNGVPVFKFKGDKLVELTVSTVGDFDTPDVIRGLLDLEVLNMPNVTSLEFGNILNCPKLKKVYLPNIRRLGDSCISHCESLEEVYAPLLECTYSSCFSYNKNLKKVSLPSLVEVRNNACFSSSGYEELDLPKLVRVGYSFCKANKHLKHIHMPKLKCVAEFSFSNLDALEELSLPELQYIEGRKLISENSKLKKVKLDKLMVIPPSMFDKCPLLEEVDAPKIYQIELGALSHHPNLKCIKAPILAEKLKGTKCKSPYISALMDDKGYERA